MMFEVTRIIKGYFECEQRHALLNGRKRYFGKNAEWKVAYYGVHVMLYHHHCSFS